MSRPPLGPRFVRLYAALARLLPPDLRADRQAMVAAFEDQWADTGGRGARLRLALRSVAALTRVGLVEWIEFLGLRSTPERPTKPWGGGGMGFVRNLRYAIRTLRRAPAFTITAVGLVGLGVGAVTAIFTLVDHVLLRPLPYPEPDRLVGLENGAFQGPLFREFEGVGAMASWGAARTERVNLTGTSEPLRLVEAQVTSDFLGLFGARAQQGRLLDPSDPPSVGVLDAGAWRRIWGGDPDIVGRSITVDGSPVTVVGILDDAFTAPETLVGGNVSLWRLLDWSQPYLSSHESWSLQVAGRLRAGVDVETAQEGVDAVMARMADVHENYQVRGGGPREIGVTPLGDLTVARVRSALGLMMGAASLLMLVACANVANLFLARGLGRVREMAVRRALGAGTGNLTGQLVVESLVVGLAGSVVGASIATAGVRAFMRFNPSALPRQAAVGVDASTLMFSLAVAAGTSLAFGLLPALRSMRGGVADELRSSGRAATGDRRMGMLRNALVVAEVALSLVLVAGAGLLLRSYMAVQAQEPGFAVDGVWTVSLELADPDGPDAYRTAMDELLRHAAAVPGVRAAAYGLTAPMDRTGGSRCCWRTTPTEGPEPLEGTLSTWMHPVSADYFEAVGVELVAGRRWSMEEGRSEPAPVVVNETYARTLAGAPSAALGTRLAFSQMQAVVVGVVADDRHYGLDQPIEGSTYVPIERLPFPTSQASLIVRVDPAVEAGMPRALREAVWAADPALPVPSVRSMAEAVAASTAARRFEWLLFGAFGGVALLLAAGGLYGTLLYVAGQRRRELGIRLALGASRGRLERALLASGITLGAFGVAVGLGGAWMATRLLESRVWGVERGDPLTLGGAALVLLLTAVLASWLPARRAGRVDPMETLRAE